MSQVQTCTFLSKLNKNKPIILSFDLDNTLVNRKKGDNFVYRPTLSLLKKLSKQKKVIFLPNTGRDKVGFASFCRDALRTKNAVLGSGSLILIDDKTIFNKKSKIKKPAINILLKAVKEQIIPFVDLTFAGKRLIIFNLKEYKSLFYAQNPRSWFGKSLPKIYHIDKIKQFDYSNLFRIEFPVFKNQGQLYLDLINKKENCLDPLSKLLKINKKKLSDYSLKRKVHFNENYRDKAIFARFEKQSSFVSKGEGLKNWLIKSKLNLKDINIIHIGDRDSGLINDTLIKKSVKNAFVVLVGEKCQLNNPDVDLYLRDGDVDVQVYEFLLCLSR